MEKGNGIYLFGVTKRLTFLEINTSNGNSKKDKIVMVKTVVLPFRSFTVTIVCYSNGTGQ